MVHKDTSTFRAVGEKESCQVSYLWRKAEPGRDFDQLVPHSERQRAVLGAMYSGSTVWMGVASLVAYSMPRKPPGEVQRQSPGCWADTRATTHIILGESTRSRDILTMSRSANLGLRDCQASVDLVTSFHNITREVCVCPGCFFKFYYCLKL